MTDLRKNVVGSYSIIENSPKKPDYMSHGMFLVKPTNPDKLLARFSIVGSLEEEDAYFFVVDQLQRKDALAGISKADQKGWFVLDGGSVKVSASLLSAICDEVYLVAKVLPLTLIEVKK